MSEVQIPGSETLFLGGDEYFKAVLAEFKKAERSIKIETYIFQEGILAERIVVGLAEALQRGVKVYLHIDAAGSPAITQVWRQQFKAMGIRFRIYNRISKHLYRIFDDLHEILRLPAHINRRNHRKFFLIDEQIGFIGSFNIDDRHLKEVYGDQAWIDIGVRVEGREMKDFGTAFDRLFFPRRFRFKPLTATKHLLLNHGLYQRLRSRRQIPRRLVSAKERIWIQNPYLVPIRPIFRALLQQASRGVDIRVITPQKNDIFSMPWISSS